MKKYGVLLILICLMFVVGCVSGNYFKVPTDEKDSGEESELIKEIQQIERQLNSLDNGEEDLGEDVAEDMEAITDEEADETVEEEVIEEETTEADEITAGEETDKEVAEEIVEEEEEIMIDTSNLEKLEVKETDLVNLEVDVQDLDEDQVTYSFSKPLDVDGKWQTNYGDAGEYIITIAADDGKTSSEKKILLVVLRNNVPPVIEGLQSAMKAKEGDMLSLTPQVSDPNKDEIEIIFPAPFDELGGWETDHTSAGVYELTVEASDGELKAEFDITLTVEDVNMPPEISGLEESMFVDEGETVTFNPEVTDLDGDEVKLTISEPVGSDGVWETGYTDHGEYTVLVTADDGKDVVEFNVDLTVEDVNVAPEIIGVRLS